MNLDYENVKEVANNLSNMADQTLYDSIQSIEKLHMKLMMEYNVELQRAQALGVFKKYKAAKKSVE